MAQSLTTYVCKTQGQAAEVESDLLGQGYEIVFGPERVDFGTTDLTGIGRENHPFADVWVVIGKK